MLLYKFAKYLVGSCEYLTLTILTVGCFLKACVTLIVPAFGGNCSLLLVQKCISEAERLNYYAKVAQLPGGRSGLEPGSQVSSAGPASNLLFHGEGFWFGKMGLFDLNLC